MKVTPFQNFMIDDIISWVEFIRPEVMSEP
jgi:hypothetical protein